MQPNDLLRKDIVSVLLGWHSNAKILYILTMSLEVKATQLCMSASFTSGCPRWWPLPLHTPSTCHLTRANLVSMPSNHILTFIPTDHPYGLGNFYSPLLVSWVSLLVLHFQLYRHLCCLRRERPLLSALDLQELPIRLLVSSSPIPPGEETFGHVSLELLKRHWISIPGDKLELSRVRI